MATIKAPFNFVPLNDKDNVFFPDDWADKISQDIPFKDGVTGTIELNITAQTPIFVRNGHTKEDADAKNEKYVSFSKTPDNQYFIPATSIKGCIRNVLEIMSFGKMTQVDNASFGKRDLDDNSYTSLMRKVKCGWLSWTNDGYIIENHGTPKRVSIKDIDKLLGGNSLYKFITETDFANNDSDKLARKKYEIIYKIKNKNAETSTKDGYETFVSSNDYLLTNDKGTFVLTGQSSKRYFDPEAKKPIVGKDGKKTGCWKGKEKEFLFPSKCDEHNIIPVDEKIFKAFETIHKDSEDYYSFWKKKLYKGQKIPVFFILKNNELHSFGLTGLFKYPYKKTVYDAIPAELKNPERSNKEIFKMDLAECMFGFAFSDMALRGRVHFGNALAQGQPIPMSDKRFVSASPHPSYYPLYVNNGYNWDMASRIAGRKRYPIRRQADYKNEGTARMEQTCSMLNKGTVFKEKIVFHNLKPIELGALLSAITFHKNQNRCFHNLGFGKPYGYGSVKVSDIKLGYVDNSMDFYMLEFEKEMEKHIPGWKQSPAMKELINMAEGIPVGYEKEFQYLKMSNDKNANEFVEIKNNGERLHSFSEIVKRECSIQSILDNFVSKEEEQKAKLEEEKRLEEIRQKENEEQKKKEEKFASLDFSFLVEETKFKTGWEKLRRRLKDSGKEFDNNIFLQLSDDNQSSIVDFCKRMFSRKDSKWGRNNNDYAKEFAIEEIKKVIGKGYMEL